MKNLSRVHALDRKRIASYTLWEAYPNPFHPGCYCLKVDWRRGATSGHIGTFFYEPGKGPTLAEVVGRIAL